MSHQSFLPPGPAGPLIKRQTQIKVGSAWLRAELTSPVNPAGWIIFVQPEPETGARADQVAYFFNQVGLATLTVNLRLPTDRPQPTSTADLKLAAERLQAITHWLRSQPESQGQPISYFGLGLGTAIALRVAATDPQIAAVVSWNGRPELAWGQLGYMTAPALLMVGQTEQWLRRYLNRLAHWRLGTFSRFMVVPDSLPAIQQFAYEWFSRPGAAPAYRLGNYAQRSLRQQLAAGALLLAFSLPLTASPLLAASAQNLAGLSPMISSDQPAANLSALNGANLLNHTQAAAATQPVAPAPTVEDSDDLNFTDSYVIPLAAVNGDGFALSQTQAASDTQKVDQNEQRPDGSYKLGHNDTNGDGIGVLATGSQKLIDANGLKYFVNTAINFSTTSSASAAMSEAAFTHAVAATTLAGGTDNTTLNDAFDGYNTMCVSRNNTIANCQTSNANFVIYNKLGPATLDATCSNRQVLFPIQTIGSLSLWRKVFVPSNDSFARWLNFVKNNGATPQTVTLVIANNLGSDSNTVIYNSSDGNTTAGPTDTWVGTFQNYSGTTSRDVRLAHVLQGPGASTGLAGINFVNGDDNPFWGYTFTVNPGQTVAIMNFVAGQPSKAAAAAKAAELVNLPDNSLQCMTSDETGQVINFKTATMTYLPLIFKAFVSAPDLVIDNITATGSAVTVTIRNAGTAATPDDFWVDVYFNPNPAPPRINQTWQSSAPAGANWGVTTPLAPGQSLTLVTGGAYYVGGSSAFPAGANVYGYVDSVNYATIYGNILESNEANNVFGPVVSTAGVAGAVAPQGKTTSLEGLPER